MLALIQSIFSQLMEFSEAYTDMMYEEEPEDTQPVIDQPLVHILTVLPAKDIDRLLDHLDYPELLQLAQCNRSFYEQIISRQQHWRRTYLRRYPLFHSDKEAAFLAWCLCTDPHKQLALTDPQDAYSLHNWRELLRRRTLTARNWLQDRPPCSWLEPPTRNPYLVMRAPSYVGHALLHQNRCCGQPAHDGPGEILLLRAGLDPSVSLPPKTEVQPKDAWQLDSLPAPARANAGNNMVLAHASHRHLALNVVDQDAGQLGIRVLDRQTLQVVHERFFPKTGAMMGHGSWILEAIDPDFEDEDKEDGDSNGSSAVKWRLWHLEQQAETPSQLKIEHKHVTICYADARCIHLYAFTAHADCKVDWSLLRFTLTTKQLDCLGSGHFRHAAATSSPNCLYRRTSALDNYRILLQFEDSQQRRFAVAHSLTVEARSGEQYTVTGGAVETFEPHEKLMVLPRGFVRLTADALIGHPTGRADHSCRYDWPVGAELHHLVDNLCLLREKHGDSYAIHLVDAETGSKLRTLELLFPMSLQQFDMVMAVEGVLGIMVWDYGAY